MTEKIATLINALRQELEQYRVMLALLDRQKQQVGARCAEDVYQSIAPIKGQGLSIQRARAQREECRVQLTQALQRPRVRWCGKTIYCWRAFGNGRGKTICA